MTEGGDSKRKMHGRLRVVLAVIAFLVLVLVVPPLINVNRYKSRITQLISQTLGRPVHLSSVQVRLLPWPGFEISNLSVAEDPAYGAEPVLYASQVIASIRLLALLRGRVEVGKISVDLATLNLVRAGPGRWNLDPLFRTAAVQTGTAPGARNVAPLPYLEATDSRIDFKNGTEKLPFSLVNADLSFWQENPGEWRIRLRGQPARTDVSIYQEETGVVRIEASVRRAPALRLMPLHLDLDWREAQLGQLARIVTGSDPGWRGDLTGELHLDGTADAAKISMRLRASGVHRAEFTPESPLDFDASCSLVYSYPQRSMHNLACDSPLGDGHVHVTGEKLGEDIPPSFSVALDQIPVAAGLDAIRTLRSGINPDLEARGTISGKIVYARQQNPQTAAAPSPPHHSAQKKASRGLRIPSPAGPLTGRLTVSNLILSGGGLTRPIQSPKITLEPVSLEPASRGQSAALIPSQALAGTFTIPAGSAVPLTLNLRLALSGYRLGVRGQASFARAREMAGVAGIPETGLLASLAGDPIAVDLTAAGPWLPRDVFPLPSSSST
ncbi:MAG: AsmA family protein, partial [Terracidiphilus sp.]